MMVGVRFHARETVAIVQQLDFPIRALVYEETAEIAGALWQTTPQGNWRLLRSFAGTGFKEYTSLTAVSPP